MTFVKLKQNINYLEKKQQKMLMLFDIKKEFMFVYVIFAISV